MRTQTALFAALLTVAAASTGCSLPVDFWQQNSVSVEAVQGMPMAMTMQQTVNVAQQPEGADLGDVTQLQIPEIILEISDVQASNQATELSGSITITNPNDSSAAPIVLPFSNMPVSDNGTVTLTPDAAQQSALSTLMLTQKEYTQSVSLSVNALPAQFSLTTHVHVVAYIDIQKAI